MQVGESLRRRDHRSVLFDQENRDRAPAAWVRAREIDMIAPFCPDLDRCYLLPAAEFAGRLQIQLRLSPTKNNQQLLINWAKEYEFTATLRRLGAVAQLGERRDGIAKATGSSPVGSTRSPPLAGFVP